MSESLMVEMPLVLFSAASSISRAKRIPSISSSSSSMPLDRLLAPLGPLLPEGGETLEAAIEETREELTGFVRAEAARQAGQGRITAALCLSGACLLILVLL